jgi:hypothetical protein
MTDQEAIRQMAYAAGISAEVRDHAISAIETLAKARKWLAGYYDDVTELRDLEEILEVKVKP